MNDDLQETEAAAGTETVPWEEPEGATGLAVIEPTPELVAAAKRAVIDKTPPPEIGDPNIAARMILERIADGTLEDSMTPQEGLPAWGEELRDVPVVVRGFHLNPSSFEVSDGPNKGRKGVYAVVEIADPSTQELGTVQVGSDTVVMQLIKAWEEGAFPFVAVLTARDTSSPGREVYYLQRPDGQRPGAA